MLLHLVLGFALGAASSVVPGPCGLAVITSAASRGLGRSIAIAAGGGLGDGTYAALGVVGIAPLVARFPLAPLVLQTLGGLALVAFGLARLLGPRTDAPPSPPRSVASRPVVHATAGGVVVGLGAVLANPAGLISWGAVLAAIVTRMDVVNVAATIVGIGVGSAAWLSILAAITNARASTRDALVHRATRVVSVVLVASGALALARAAHSWP